MIDGRGNSRSLASSNRGGPEKRLIHFRRRACQNGPNRRGSEAVGQGYGPGGYGDRGNGMMPAAMVTDDQSADEVPERAADQDVRQPVPAHGHPRQSDP